MSQANLSPNPNLDLIYGVMWLGIMLVMSAQMAEWEWHTHTQTHIVVILRHNVTDYGGSLHWLVMKSYRLPFSESPAGLLPGLHLLKALLLQTTMHTHTSTHTHYFTHYFTLTLNTHTTSPLNHSILPPFSLTPPLPRYVSCLIFLITASSYC